MNIDFWKNKRVLITGHTGFKGTWLTLLLKRLGAIVAGYALSPEKESLFEQAEVLLDYHCEGDLRNQNRFVEFMKIVQPEIVIHLGSYGFIHESLQDPINTFSTNTVGLVNVLESVRECASVRAVVIVTSDKCYENLETEIPYTEESRLGAQDPYSASKACQELITKSYCFSYFNYQQTPLVATARASNVIGGGDVNKTRLIPHLIERFSSGETAVIRNPDTVRPWQYVLDVLNGYLILAENLYNGKRECASAFNFGPDKSNFVTVRYITNQLSELFDSAQYEVIPNKSGLETNILKLDSFKAKNRLKWNQFYQLEDVLKLVVDFRKRELLGDKAKSICQNQIELFLMEAHNDQ